MTPTWCRRSTPRRRTSPGARTTRDDGKPLRAHQYQERYFPGSTFKVVTGSTGLQTGTVTVDTPSYPVATSYTPPQTNKSISNFGGESCGGTLFNILRVSCNSAFAQMGTETIGPDKMIAGAQAFGFNSKPPIDLPDPAASFFPDQLQGRPARPGPVVDRPERRAGHPAADGLVAATIANGGRTMKPHVVREVRDSEGSVIERGSVSQWLQPISADNAATMRQAMIDVVQNGHRHRP